jgi:parallel beta-helix repeat protein
VDNFIGIVVSQTGTQEAGERYVGATHVAIQAAVDYCNSMGGGKIFIEKGTYDIQSPINLYSNIEVYGEGIGTVLKPSFANSGDVGCLQAVGTSGAELENIYIHDLLIGNTIDTKVGQHGIYCSYVGLAQTTGLTSGDYSRYDSTTVGADKPNKMGVRIENCYVQNNNSYGIYLYSSNNIITGNTVQNSNYGIYLNSSANNTITGNTVQNNSDYGIYLYSSNNNSITGNTVQNNGSQGISLGASSNNTVTGNTVQNNGSYGIYLDASSNNTITGNTVQNNSSSGIYLYSSSNNNTVTGNTVQNNSSSGIYLRSSSNNTVTGNTVQNNGSTGIYLVSSSNNNTITGNTVQNNDSIGIYLISSANNTITGNISRGNSSTNIQTSSSNNNLINGNSYGSSSYTGSGNVTSENIQQA